MSWRARSSLIAVLALAGTLPAAPPAAAKPAAHRQHAHKPRKAKIRLQDFSSCAGLVSYAQSALRSTHGAAGWPVSSGEPAGIATPTGTGPVAAGAPTAAAPTTTSGAAGAGTSYSTTNNQEQGVDEPDIAKTDGSTVFALQGNAIRAVDVSGTTPKLLGSLTLPPNESASGLLLNGNRLIVIAQQYPTPPPRAAGAAPAVPAGIAILPPAYWQSQTIFTEVDVSDPGKMAVTRTMAIDGRFVDARMNGDSARFIVESTPPAIEFPAQASAARGWIPARRFHSLLTKRRYTVMVAPCNRIRRPVQFSGLGLVTILTVDLSRGLYATDSTTVMADPQVVYGSQGSLYLATEKWIAPSTPYGLVPADSTVIDRFDLSDPTKASYAGSGVVPGYVLNQYSLSEWGGDLRVATTDRPIWWGAAIGSAPSQSYVTELRLGPGGMSQVGQVAGLGRGQKIYSVRFVQNNGYVVTFRQVDPLYTLDLSDPAAPKVAGQIELEGYSAYLHPLGGGLLLGVGNDVGADNEPSGGMLELFDVAKPAAPRLIAKTSLGAGSQTPVQYDHHAFLYWPATGLAVLPVEIYQPYAPAGPPTPAPVQGGGTAAVPCCGSQPPPFIGAIGFTLSGTGISEVGRIAHDAVNGYSPQIERSIVAGSHLYTLGGDGLMQSDLGTLARQAFVPFPQAPSPVIACGGIGISGAGVASPPAIICPGAA